MLKYRKDELSLHMRIPADRCYLENALLTLDGICEHFSVNNLSRTRIVKTLESALANSIDHSHQKFSGLFDLKFSIFKDKLQITVEDFMLADDQQKTNSAEPLSEEQLRAAMEHVISMTDDFKVFSESGRHACYSMQFNLLPAE